MGRIITPDQYGSEIAALWDQLRALKTAPALKASGAFSSVMQPVADAVLAAPQLGINSVFPAALQLNMVPALLPLNFALPQDPSYVYIVLKARVFVNSILHVGQIACNLDHIVPTLVETLTFGPNDMMSVSGWATPLLPGGSLTFMPTLAASVTNAADTIDVYEAHYTVFRTGG
jgi:hypothetical protein